MEEEEVEKEEERIEERIEEGLCIGRKTYVPV